MAFGAQILTQKGMQDISSIKSFRLIGRRTVNLTGGGVTYETVNIPLDWGDMTAGPVVFTVNAYVSATNQATGGSFNTNPYIPVGPLPSSLNFTCRRGSVTTIDVWAVEV